MKRLKTLAVVMVVLVLAMGSAFAQWTGPYFALVDQTGNVIGQSNPLWIQGTFSATIAGFQPNGNFKSISVGNTSISTVLPAGTTIQAANIGTTPVSCNFGIGSATATANEIIIQPGSTKSLVVGSNTWFACENQSGNATNPVIISGGSGLGTDSGGGGGLSPSGSPVTNAGTFAVQDNGVGITAVAGAVSGGLMQVNEAQINGTTVPTGTGLVSAAGVQRMAVGQDSNTIAGSPPGTGGFPSNSVVSVQGPSGGGTALNVIAAAGTNLNTSALALETGGNLATIASAVSAAVMQENVKQINGSVPLTSTGTATGNSLRVAVGTDSSTWAGTTPGTAGSSSAAVMSMQGIAGGTLVGISGSSSNLSAAVVQATASLLNATVQQGTASLLNATVVQATGTNLHMVCDSGCSSSTAPTDEAPFTPGSTSQTPIGGYYQVTPTNNPLSTGQMGVAQLTQYRALQTNLRNASGTEIGTASNPIQISLANTSSNAAALVISGSVTLLGTSSISGTVTANAGTNLNTSLLALETGGNLATLAGAVSAAVMQENVKQIGGSNVATATTGVQKVGIVGSGGAIFDFAGQNASSPANAVLVGCQFNTAPTGLSSGNVSPFQCDTNGNLKVNIVVGGGGSSGGTSSTFGSTFPTTGTAIGLKNGANMIQSAGDATGRALVDLFGNSGAVLDFAGQNATSPPNAMLMGGQFNTSPTGLTTGNVSPFQIDSVGSLLVNVKTIGTVTVSGTVTANAGTNMSTAALALETGGNLATLAGAITASVMQENVKQINGVTPLMGAGATGTGSQRVTLAQDTSTIGGSAPGTAGSPGTQVVTVQGPTTGGTAVPVSAASSAFTATVVQPSGSSLHMSCDSGCSSSPAPADETAFTFGTQSTTPIAGAYQTAATSNPLSAGQMGVAQLTQFRALQTNLRNAAGTEVGTATTPLQVSLANNGTNTTPVVVNNATGMQERILGNAGAILDFAGQNAATPANSVLIGCQFNTSPTTVTSGNATPEQCDNAGNRKVNVVAGSLQNVPGTSGGLSDFSEIVAANTTSVAIKASPGQIYDITTFNNSTTLAYGKIYDALQGSTTCGSGTPKKRFLIPGQTGGSGFIYSEPQGIAFGTGITICVTLGIADNDTAAPSGATYIVDIGYK